MEDDNLINEKHFTKALKNGVLIDILDVENGLNCDCVCPSCETPVVAYNNPKNKNAHHFKHHNKRDCRFYYETMLHYMAKEIIAKELKLKVPKHEFSLSDSARDYQYNSNRIAIPYESTSIYEVNFDTIEVEKYQDGIKPDLIGKIKNKELHIEVAVTHFIDDEKLSKIERNGVTSIEIDLSKFDREIHEKQLKIALDGNIKLMKWINNQYIQDKKQLAEEKKIKIRDFIYSKTKEKPVYGRQNIIYKCPLTKSKEISKSNCLSCRFMSYEKETLQVINWEDRKIYENSFIGCIGHVKKEFDTILKFNGVKIGENNAFN
ncbi:hypothetical protein ERX46_12340 [Brumimicrobium glaciale]|uniref:Competence protein n=1 Tax=Brumimicrobium glaciale TaxID=200475 RepID=A0A4Q4KI07_9FLAO|nr:hypothetical protein [Brumimicrobium glaciale]RYM32842.1 hypothetical protein ERX46_12340 [Brumimicrobium glaciale]